MTILPTLALRSFVGFDNLFNELESISNQKQSSFPAHDIIRISDDEYEITLAVSGFNKKDISIDVHDGVLTIKGNGGSEIQNDIGTQFHCHSTPYQLYKHTEDFHPQTERVQCQRSLLCASGGKQPF